MSTDTVITLRWLFHCCRCRNEWEEEQDVSPEDVEFQSPTVPRYCPKCAGKLVGEPHAWNRRFEVVEVVEF